MTPDELVDALDDFGITPYRFAKILGTNKSTPLKWIKPGATVPGYVEVIIQQMYAIRELERLAKQEAER